MIDSVLRYSHDRFDFLERRNVITTTRWRLPDA